MAEYKNDEPCEYIYDVVAVTKVVDGDTLDCVFDLGFDVRFESRVRPVSYTHLTLPTIYSV